MNNRFGITRDLPPLLTREQEVELCTRVEAGVLAAAVLDGEFSRPDDATDAELHALVDEGLAAWHDFLRANLRLVMQVAAKTMRRTSAPPEDLFQDGAVMLAEAVRRFDCRLGVRFSTYGYDWVRNGVMHCATLRAGAVEAPLWRAQEAIRLRQRMQQLPPVPLREAVAQLAGESNRSSTWVLEVLACGPASPLDETNMGALGVVPAAEDTWVARTVEEPEWFAHLGSSEAMVLRLRHGFVDGIDHDYPQVARRLGVSVSTVRRIERRALSAARELLGPPEVVAA